MSTVFEIMDGIADRLRTISGLRVEAVFEGTINPPTAIVGLPTITNYHATMARGRIELEPSVTVFVSAAVDRVGQTLLSEFASPVGSRSIRAAVEGDRTLGGTVDDCHVIGFRPLDMEEYSAFLYFGGVFSLYAIARGDQ